MKINKWPEWISIFHGLMIMGLIGVGFYVAQRVRKVSACQLLRSR